MLVRWLHDITVEFVILTAVVIRCCLTVFIFLSHHQSKQLTLATMPTAALTYTHWTTWPSCCHPRAFYVILWLCPGCEKFFAHSSRLAKNLQSTCENRDLNLSQKHENLQCIIPLLKSSPPVLTILIVPVTCWSSNNNDVPCFTYYSEFEEAFYVPEPPVSSIRAALLQPVRPTEKHQL